MGRQSLLTVVVLAALVAVAHCASLRGSTATATPAHSVGSNIVFGDEPESCKKEAQKLCGHCGNSQTCWIACAKSHQSALKKAGCHYPEATSPVEGEPESCKKEAQKLCGHCGSNKSCWISCAEAHQSALKNAGCHYPEATSPVEGEPESCKKEAQKLCGHCGSDKSCWISCAEAHQSALKKAGCHYPEAQDKIPAGPLLVMHRIIGEECTQIDVRGGESSPFWVVEAWRYAEFHHGGCPSKFDTLLRRTTGVHGFAGTTLNVLSL